VFIQPIITVMTNIRIRFKWEWELCSNCSYCSCVFYFGRIQSEWCIVKS